MSVSFSDHAIDQIKRRNIPKKKILKTVREYEEIEPSYKNRKLRRRKVGSKMLEVVTRTE